MRKIDFRIWVGLVAFACLDVLLVLYALWRREAMAITAAEELAAIVSVALFAALGVRFLFVWLPRWRDYALSEEAPTRSVPERPRPSELIRVFLVLLLVSASTQVLYYVLRFMANGGCTFREAMDSWTRLDTQHYLDIAREWYLSEGSRDRVVQLVFLPGYPLVIRLFSVVIRSELAAAMTASALCFAAAGVVLYRLARLDMDRAGAVRVLKYTCILPGAFFFSAPMSESLFLLLSVSCVYLIRRRRWLAAGLLGALASFTRSLGLMLAVPLCFELIEDAVAYRREWGQKALWRRIAPFLCVFIVPLGFGAYCLICRAVSGDPLKFLEYQRDHWHQSMGLFFGTAAYQTQYAVSSLRAGNLSNFMGLWLPNLFCSFGALALMIPAVRRLRPSYTAYFIAYYVIAIGPTWLLSAPRYLVALFPLSFAVAALTEDRRNDDIVTVALTAVYVVYLMAMACGWQVW